MIRRFTLPLVIAFCFLAIIPARHAAAAKDTWTSVRSKNFFLVGNASEKEIRQVAVRLEQFRDVFSRLFPTMIVSSPVPSTVVVFKNGSSYKPFMPLADGRTVSVAGYFKSGSDVNYITLTTEQMGEGSYRTIFHEYVHQLMDNTMGRTNVPTWFNEGIAEYYSTFDIDGDRKVYLGKLIPQHLDLLRTTPLLPLDKLFAVDYYSLDRNKHGARGLFYAQSWALVHYLIQGNEGKRVKDLDTFVSLLRQNVPVETAFRQAFQTDYAGMLTDFRNYLQRDSFRIQYATFEKKLEFDSEMKAAPISEAEVQAYLGDLLYHIDRHEEAKAKLELALALDPKLPMAHASLGMVLMEQKKIPEARAHLEQAVSGNSANYLLHYYFALALSREVMTEGQPVYRFPPDTAKRMRAELRRAIELNPEFPESYRLLAFINLVTGEQLDESIALIKRGMALSPGNEDFLFVLAQLYMRMQDFVSARKVVEPLAANGSNPRIRADSQGLLVSINSIEEEMARFRAGRNDPALASPHGSPIAESNEIVIFEHPDPNTVLRQALRKPEAGETQSEGTLIRIDCDAKGITFVIRMGDQLLQLRSASFRQVRLKTFNANVAGEITCGPHKPEKVVVSYVAKDDAGTKSNGTIRSVEFVPAEFVLKHP
jgi:tetratricopeptide (TPR) repeat protein